MSLHNVLLITCVYEKKKTYAFIHTSIYTCIHKSLSAHFYTLELIDERMKYNACILFHSYIQKCAHYTLTFNRCMNEIMHAYYFIHTSITVFPRIKPRCVLVLLCTSALW